MKRIIPILIILILIFVSGCKRDKDVLFPYGWSKTIPEFDSITLAVERLYIDHADLDSIHRLIVSLREIANKNPEIRQLDSRATYWEGRYLYTYGDFDKGIEKMEDALQKTDSIKFPYDYHRIAWNLDLDYHEPTLSRYNFLIDELNFFRKAKDYSIAGAYAMEVGTFLDDIGDTEHGKPYLVIADSLFLIGGFRDQISNNRINHARAITIEGDTANAEKMYRAILNDSSTPLSPYARDIVLGNIYSLNEDTTTLRIAYNLVKDNPKEIEAQCMYENFLGQEKLKINDIDSARYYLQRAQAHMPETYRPDVQLEFFQLKYNFYERTGRIDSAYKYLKIASILNDSINMSDKDIEVRNAILTAEIEEAKLSRDLKNRKLTIIYLAGIIAIIIICSGIIIIMRRRVEKQKIEKLNIELEAERANRRMMAMKVALDEKDTLLSTMESEAQKLRETGDITDLAAGKLQSTIKVHMGSESQREAFIDTYGNINPEFTLRLKELYPNLTQADHKLAAFVAMEMDNKHIARVMGIRPESVKQARWRLRTKMSLEKGESLEDAIRKISTKK